MERKEFKKITKTHLLNYGFAYFNKKFYLVLDHIIIRLQYIPYPFDQGIMISYNMIVKELSNFQLNDLSDIEKAFEDLTEIPVQMPALKNIEVNINHNNAVNIFIPSQIDESEWNVVFSQALHEVFDPFKLDDLKQLKITAFSKDPHCRIIVNKKVKDFLINSNNV